MAVDEQTKCRGCGKPVIWIKNENGKNICLDARNHPIYWVLPDGSWDRVHGAKITHFATCPKANEFSKSAKR